MPKVKDLKGMRFGRLLVIGEHGKDKYHYMNWVCLCDCGNTHITSSSSLIGGDTKSCGCFKIDMLTKRLTKHGLIVGGITPLYRVWNNMRSRCLYPSVKAYKNYGGRGISVCDEWNNFEPFHEWAINNGYSEKLQLDRINNDGNYCPINCEFVTRKENLQHTRNRNKLIINGIEKGIREWANEIPITIDVFYRWFAQGEQYTKIKFSKYLKIEIWEIKSTKKELFTK